jgi:uncharacterized protein (TIGR02594 family)
MAGEDARKTAGIDLGATASQREGITAQAAGEPALVTPAKPKPVEFSWMTVAREEIGVKEIAGIRHTPRIIEYHATTTLKASTDEVPWCSSFVNWVMMQAGYTGTKSAAARSWADWGQGLVDPVPGCIVVMTRGSGGHVGFYIRHDADYHWILGGNQNNEVRISTYDMRKRRLLGYVLPAKMNDEDQGLYELFNRGVA